MKSFVFYLAIFNLFACFACSGQTQTTPTAQPTVQVTPCKAGWQSVYRNGRKLPKNQYIGLLEGQQNPYAFQKFNRSKDFHTLAWAAFIASAVGLGYELGGRTWIKGKKENNLFFVAAGVGLLTSLGFELIAHHKLKKSVSSYNEQLTKNTTTALQPQLYYYAEGTQVGMGIKF